MMINKTELKLLADALHKLESGYSDLPEFAPELDIVVYAVKAADTSTASERARQVFTDAASLELHLALVELPTALVVEWLPELAENSANVTCLRSVLMKPEHVNWLDEIVAILNSCAAEPD